MSQPDKDPGPIPPEPESVGLLARMFMALVPPKMHILPKPVGPRPRPAPPPPRYDK